MLAIGLLALIVLAWPARTTAVLGAVTGAVVGVAGGPVLLFTSALVLLRVGIDAATGWAPPVGALQLGLLAAAFMASAATGITHGIRWLGNLNLTIAVVLMLVLLALGAPAAVISLGADALARWAAAMPGWSLGPIEMQAGDAWADDWTITYLIWWIAWTPFVGLFIARISRGRTLRALRQELRGATPEPPRRD